MPALHFYDYAAYKPLPGTPPRTHGCVIVNGYRVFHARKKTLLDRATDREADRARDQHRAQLTERMAAIHASLAAMRRDGECDNGRPHKASTKALRLRLELIGLLVEHRVMQTGACHTMPKALILVRELDAYKPSASTITHLCYWYRLRPLWLLLGLGEAPVRVEGRF